MARALRLLNRATGGRGALALAVAAAVGLGAFGCGSDQGCEFDFAHDAVTYDEIPWVCRAGDAPPLTVLFRADGSGLLDGKAAFEWRVTSCRTTTLDLADSTSLDLLELGGNVDVARLTFVLDGATYLCGYGVPPP